MKVLLPFAVVVWRSFFSRYVPSAFCCFVTRTVIHVKMNFQYLHKRQMVDIVVYYWVVNLIARTTNWIVLPWLLCRETKVRTCLIYRVAEGTIRLKGVGSPVVAERVTATHVCMPICTQCSVMPSRSATSIARHPNSENQCMLISPRTLSPLSFWSTTEICKSDRLERFRWYSSWFFHAFVAHGVWTRTWIDSCIR